MREQALDGRIEVLDANHFDPYFEPSLTLNLGYQLDSLKRLPEVATSASGAA